MKFKKKTDLKGTKNATDSNFLFLQSIQFVYGYSSNIIRDDKKEVFQMKQCNTCSL